MKKLLFEELLLEYNRAYMYSWTNDKDIVDRFWKIKNLLGTREESDINWWIKNKTPQEFEKFVIDYETGVFKTNTQAKKIEKSTGAEIVYDDHKYWKVYFVMSYKAAKRLGRNTKWCIAGNYAGYEDQGEKYFNEYIESEDLLDGGYYFCFDLTNKNNNGDYYKYCILVDTEYQINSIWDSHDERIDKIPVLHEEQAIQFIPEVQIPYDIYDQYHFLTTDVGWHVLDKKEDSVLLLFDVLLKYPIESYSGPYHKLPEEKDLTWASSDIRKWLNTHLDLFFTNEEQKKLITTKLDMLPAFKRPTIDQGSATVDKLFLLSTNEALEYSKRSEENNKAIFDWPYTYWLRDISEPYPSGVQNAMTIHRPRIDVVGNEVDTDYICVRPACWFKIK